MHILLRWFRCAATNCLPLETSGQVPNEQGLHKLGKRKNETTLSQQTNHHHHQKSTQQHGVEFRRCSRELRIVDFSDYFCRWRVYSEDLSSLCVVVDRIRRLARAAVIVLVAPAKSTAAKPSSRFRSFICSNFIIGAMTTRGWKTPGGDESGTLAAPDSR
jgi:hypothetical protein